MKKQFKVSLLMLAICLSSSASAAISAAEAAKLGGPELTETGAIKAGNADGSIPPFSAKRPAAVKPPASAGKFPYGDPYAADKPLFSIDASNMAKYADKLSEGNKALLTKFPTFRIDVYPTRRETSFPDDVLANTPKCAQTANLVGNGDGLEGIGARCVPFPIPKTGYEALWNTRLRVGTNATELQNFKIWMVDSNGNHTLNQHTKLLSVIDTNKTSGPITFQNRLISETLTPASEAGALVMRWAPLRMDQSLPQAWSYIPGQRRVRLAPEAQYDTVATSTGGLIVFDEINLIDGRLDRFDYSNLKLREMIVPYHSVRSQHLPVDQLDMKNHPKPENLRWELRRVFEVSGDLKAGQRHIYKRKVYYIDQDAWGVVGYDSFDQAGRLYRTGMTQPFFRNDSNVVNFQSILMWDLTKDIWGWVLNYHDGFIKDVPFPGEKVFSPDSLAGGGIR
jgi:hypothetical protein